MHFRADSHIATALISVPPCCCSQVVASGHLDEVQELLNGNGTGEHFLALQ
jgi:hypothetical protein